MSTRRRWKEGRDKRERGRFLALPYAVLISRAYLSLSPHAVKLLIDLGVQYNGRNNGDLGIAWRLMRLRGWRSEETLAKAKRELLQTQLIVETRKGGRPNRASLYALTFFALDHCDGKLDIAPPGFPYGAWKTMERLSITMPIARNDAGTAQKNAVFATPAVVESPGLLRLSY